MILERLLWLLPSRIIDRRNQRLLNELLMTLVLAGGGSVEHEALRTSLGWSAHRFDIITDLLDDAGLLDYRIDFDAPNTSGGGHLVLYYLTDAGWDLVCEGRCAP